MGNCGVFDGRIMGGCPVKSYRAGSDNDVADIDMLLDSPRCPDPDEGVYAQLCQFVNGDRFGGFASLNPPYRKTSFFVTFYLFKRGSADPLWSACAGDFVVSSVER